VPLLMISAHARPPIWRERYGYRAVAIGTTTTGVSARRTSRADAGIAYEYPRRDAHARVRLGSASPPRENARVPTSKPFMSTALHRLRRLTLAGMLAAACVPVPAHALTLLAEENPPFNYTANGKLTGLVTDLVTEAAKRANVPYTIEVLPWNRAYMRAQAEKDTCLFATARLDSREKLFTWVGPFANNLWAVYGRGNFAGSVRVLVDLKPYSIGGVVNDAKVEYLKENGITNIKQVIDDRMNPPRLLLPADDPDHIDLWVTGYYGERDLARAAKITDIKLVFIVREIPLYLACSPRTSPAVVKALSETVEKMRADGLFTKAAATYEGKFVQ
jgi:polar amino acid transport system substrate-binding protein